MPNARIVVDGVRWCSMVFDDMMPRGVVENVPRRARLTKPRYRIRNRVVNESKRMKFVAVGQHGRNDRGGVHGRLRSGSGQAFLSLVYTDQRAGRGLLCKARPTLMQGLRYSWPRETCDVLIPEHAGVVALLLPTPIYVATSPGYPRNEVRYSIKSYKSHNCPIEPQCLAPTCSQGSAAASLCGTLAVVKDRHHLAQDL